MLLPWDIVRIYNTSAKILVCNITFPIGVVLTRKVKKLPRKRCWFVGYSKEDDVVDKAYKFNNTWEVDLRVGVHDCRDYTNGSNLITIHLFFFFSSPLICLYMSGTFSYAK